MSKKKKISNKTVGDLIKELEKLDQNLPVVHSEYKECITDAGTDMGGEEYYEVQVNELHDRVVLAKSTWIGY